MNAIGELGQFVPGNYDVVVRAVPSRMLEGMAPYEFLCIVHKHNTVVDATELRFPINAADDSAGGCAINGYPALGS